MKEILLILAILNLLLFAFYYIRIILFENVNKHRNELLLWSYVNLLIGLLCLIASIRF